MMIFDLIVVCIIGVAGGLAAWKIMSHEQQLIKAHENKTKEK